MTTAATERAHALLSASSSKQWLTCTPSARLGEQFQDTDSEHSAAGTLAHDISELKLRKQFIEPMTTKVFNAELKKLKGRQYEGKPLFQEEMMKHTDTYVEYASKIVHAMASPPYVGIEKSLKYDMYAPEGFGTGDLVILGGNTLHIIDFKYGQGVSVVAEGNTQMKLYALGAYWQYSFLYPIETVKMAIIQPRATGITESTVTVQELLAWGESIKPIAQKAFAGEGEYVPGEHCMFCKAKQRCTAIADQFIALEESKIMKPPLITFAEVGDYLRRAEGIVSWYESLKKAAMAELLKGGEVDGWKAVAGRGSRQYVDIDVAFNHLKANGIAEEILYDRVPVTLPALEKLLKTKQYKELLKDAGHELKLPGAPTLAAAASDPREAIKPVSAAEDFKDIIGKQVSGNGELGNQHADPQQAL